MGDDKFVLLCIFGGKETTKVLYETAQLNKVRSTFSLPPVKAKY